MLVVKPAHYQMNNKRKRKLLAPIATLSDKNLLLNTPNPIINGPRKPSFGHILNRNTLTYTPMSRRLQKQSISSCPYKPILPNIQNITNITQQPMINNSNKVRKRKRKFNEMQGIHLFSCFNNKCF